jgi:hypothetical protein
MSRNWWRFTRLLDRLLGLLFLCCSIRMALCLLSLLLLQQSDSFFQGCGLWLVVLLACRLVIMGHQTSFLCLCLILGFLFLDLRIFFSSVYF